MDVRVGARFEIHEETFRVTGIRQRPTAFVIYARLEMVEANSGRPRLVGAEFPWQERELTSVRWLGPASVQ